MKLQPELGAGPSCLAGQARWEQGNVPWSLGHKDWGSLAGRPITHLLFQVVLVPIESVDVVGEGCPEGQCWGYWDWMVEWVLWVQSPVGGRGGGVVYLQVSHLLVRCQVTLFFYLNKFIHFMYQP